MYVITFYVSMQNTSRRGFTTTYALSPLMLWVWILIRAWCTTLCGKVCQWIVTGRWFPPGPLVSSTNKTDHHNITEILLKVALNTIHQSNQTIYAIYALQFVTKFFFTFFLFIGNPLEEKCTTDGTWRNDVAGRLPKLKKLDGEFFS